MVYRINCKDCEATYVGQTERQFKTRINEHIRDIKKATGSPFVVSIHRMNFKHEFNWNNIKILDKEPSCSHQPHKRIVSEVIHIKKQPQGITRGCIVVNTFSSYLGEADLSLNDISMLIGITHWELFTSSKHGIYVKN
ncbi:uncharacterized protein LOC105429419 [Pogonomyrmex barbatus]|uniref:Uncharacterized protein LOC105429419 n=1 Tax=Pogonomyrmex barbatus TaxID=144034 RepID=A0A6I9WM99_9HYME|nr:uncharacterized protein LOC105429419 [Pogonomyrmex barbatus]